MSIHRIVEDAVRQIEQYDIPREIEKFEMIYCMGRIEASAEEKGYRRAMEVLNAHLDTHYKVLEPKPPMYEARE